MRAPCGIVEIKALYGDPEPFIRDDGTVSPLWEARMTKVDLPKPLPLGWKPATEVRSVRVNRVIAEEVEAALKALVDCGVWDDFRTYDGGYCWRPKRGSDKLSMHGFGGALDFNAATNELGMVGDMKVAIVDVFEGRGWEWGGRWRRPDPMHFQWARGY